MAPLSSGVENAAGETQFPDATPLPEPGTEVSITTDKDCGREAIEGNLYTADCHVKITYRDRTLEADHIQYNKDTNDVDMTGHVLVTIGDTQEYVQASHGTINLQTETGQFFDVVGSVGAARKAPVGAGPAGTVEAKKAAAAQKYTNSNPFLFSGRMVVKTGPREYAVYGGTITSCQLPNPDWLLSGEKFSIDGTHAHARNSVFHLMGVPVLWMPYVTHPVNANDRQTGILIPEIGFNSASKGDTIGEQVYWAINRSTDLTVGTIYYSARGWEQTASLRYKGLGQDFIRSHYSALHDRGYYPGGVFVNQSGTDVTFSGRYDLIPADEGADTAAAEAAPTAGPPVQERAVVDLEYLSSFPYREAFSTNFNQAVSSDVVSSIYLTREQNDVALSLEGDRYQGEKRIATPTTAEQQVHIFHAPSLEFATTDHMLGSTGLEWNLNSSATALKRTQPNFETGGMIERVDVRPELAYPLHMGGWNLRPSVAGRETFYSRSRLPVAVSPGPGLPAVPVEVDASLNRAALDVELDARAPVLERTFDSGWVKKLLRHDVRHTIEPEVTYRYVTGINNFSNVLRFDLTDIFSNTNEVEYGLTQRLFLRENSNKPCQAAGKAADVTEVLGSAGEAADATEYPGEAMNRDETTAPVCSNREWVSWRVAQKYFFNSNFGGAVTTGPRAILDTTLDFSGISFMTRPRDISPIVSRLRVRTSKNTDVEWDFDYDTCSAGSASSVGCARRFTANNLYVDVHAGNVAAGTVVGRLNAPARSYVGGSLSSVANFTQMRVWLEVGRPNRPGFSAATSAGIDLDLGTVQYGAIQTSYNWNCCGLSIEYRKYELGTARNDNGYKFNFTLANIGSAGNLRHQDQLF